MTQTTNTLAVAILEDHPLMRDAITSAVEASGARVVLQSGRVEDFLARLARAEPKVAFIDLTLEGDRDGWAAMEAVREWYPGVRTVVVSGRDEPQAIARAQQLGAFAYLDKRHVAASGIIQALEAAARGERYLPVTELSFTAAPASPPPALAQLTHRELEVLRCVTSGADNLKIAAMLGITERTVRAHVSALYRKLEVENRSQMALLARKLGVLPREES